MHPYAASGNIRVQIEAVIRGRAWSNGLGGGPYRPFFQRVLPLAVFLAHGGAAVQGGFNVSGRFGSCPRHVP